MKANMFNLFHLHTNRERGQLHMSCRGAFIDDDNVPNSDIGLGNNFP